MTNKMVVSLILVSALSVAEDSHLSKGFSCWRSCTGRGNDTKLKGDEDEKNEGMGEIGL